MDYVINEDALEYMDEQRLPKSLLDTFKHEIPIPFNVTGLMAFYFSLDLFQKHCKELNLLEKATRLATSGVTDKNNFVILHATYSKFL